MSNQPLQRRSAPLKPVDPKEYSFDIGLSKITTNRNQKQRMSLPTSAVIEPSVGKIEQQLNSVVDMKSFESILLDALRPEVKNRTLLVPVYFRKQLSELRDTLRQELKEKRGQGSVEAIDELLANLEAQIAEETGRNELLDQYRLMILMG